MNLSFGKIFLCAACVCALPFSVSAEEAASGKISVGAGVERKTFGLDLSVPPAETKQDAAAVPAEVSEAKAVPVAAEPVKPSFPEAHRKFIFDCEPKEFSAESYERSVENLLAAYEKNTGRKLIPGEHKKVALKIYTASGRGLETPKDLTFTLPIHSCILIKEV